MISIEAWGDFGEWPTEGGLYLCRSRINPDNMSTGSFGICTVSVSLLDNILYPLSLCGEEPTRINKLLKQFWQFKIKEQNETNVSSRF